MALRTATWSLVFIITALAIRSRLFLLLTTPVKTEQTGCSETSAYKIQTPENNLTCINTLAIWSHLFFVLTPPVKVEQTGCFETSAHKNPDAADSPKRKNTKIILFLVEFNVIFFSFRTFCKLKANIFNMLNFFLLL